MGKNFTFYVFLTRNKSNSLQHDNEWDSGTSVFQWNFASVFREIFKNILLKEHLRATAFKEM